METQELDGALRRAGHRVTTPRRAVWEVIRDADAHLTAEEIAGLVQSEDPGINVSSVYRTLALLNELGLIRESSLGPSASHWEMAHPDQQFHLRCTSCGGVEHHGGDIVEQVREHLRGEHRFDATAIDLVVSGTCARCS
ncbi:MAG: transcriptional repressor [Actinobacteria bacterium]|nr:transcriptional repressor [Actinomycetota bacterium]